MTATLIEPPTSVASPARGRRERLAGLERPFLLGGLTLVVLHLLDLALSGPDPSPAGVLAIIGIPAAWFVAQPRLTRPTRLALAVVIGLLAFGFGVISHGLHVVNSGPDWRDVTGVGMIAGGVALIVAGVAAAAARPRVQRPRSGARRIAHGAGRLAAVPVWAVLVVLPFAMTLMVTHAPRWAIQERSLGIAHQEVVLETADGRKLSGWYVPSRNRAAVLLSHGSGGSRERVVAHVRMLARHGYGVLALDNPGNGESEGHSNGLGSNAQPAIATGLRWLTRRPDVDPTRIAGVGLSLGGEVLLEAAARDVRLRAVISDGSTRPMDARRVTEPTLVERASGWVWPHAVRGVSGMHEAPSIVGLMPRIAPRPVLLIAGGVGAPAEIPANRLYRDAGGSTTQLWELADTSHTGGLRTHPAAYERRTTAFLDHAFGLKDTP